MSTTKTAPEAPQQPQEGPEAEKSAMRVADPEIKALAQLDRIMAGLDWDAACRCLGWLDSRYGLESRIDLADGRGDPPF